MAAGTLVRISGTGFQSGDTVTVDGVTVDGSRVEAQAPSGGSSIFLALPAHAAGKVAVTVISALSQTQSSVPGGYTYLGPPAFELLPNIGSTGGGTPVYITGSLFYLRTVTVDGIVTPYESDIGGTAIYLSMPAHAAGTVEVLLTDVWGQVGRGEFTYVSPATFDFNGDWEGSAEYFAQELGTRLVLTIRDNRAVSVLCLVCRDPICAIGSAPSETLDPPPVVANGEFSYAGSGGVSITGRITSAVHATGSITTPSCSSRHWWANKK